MDHTQNPHTRKYNKKKTISSPKGEYDHEIPQTQTAYQLMAWVHSGSVVECLTGDQEVVALSLTGVTALCL